MRTADDLKGLDGLVIPGGESTTMEMLMERVGLLGPLTDAIRNGLPVLATCAGMILLARDISDAMPGQRGLGLLDIGVRRNGYGRQVDSFEADLDIASLGNRRFPGVFIRAPMIERTGEVEVVASYEDHPVAVKQGNILALSFHPELSGDRRLHKEFVRMASSS